MYKIWLALVFVAMAASAQAQVVTGPSQITFSSPSHAIVAVYHIDFFQCGSIAPPGSVNPGACVGRATAPFQTGVDVPKANITGSNPVYIIDLTTAPAVTVLPSLPAGMGFILTLTAVGDPSVGGTGQSVRSGDSNSFFRAGLVPAAPGNVTVKP